MAPPGPAAEASRTPQKSPSAHRGLRRLLDFPLLPQYGPTAVELIEPHWRGFPRRWQAATVAALILLVVIVAGAALTLEDPHYSHPGTPAFSFTYKDLYRTATPRGAYVETSLVTHGRLQASFEVEPLELPPYAGSLTGELPLYASTLINDLQHQGATLTGEGKTRIQGVPGYSFTYTTLNAGQPIFGRDVLLLPDVPGVRTGVVMVLRERPGGSLTNSTLVGLDGVLENPLRSFRF